MSDVVVIQATSSAVARSTPQPTHAAADDPKVPAGWTDLMTPAAWKKVDPGWVFTDRVALDPDDDLPCNLDSYETTFDGHLVDAMNDAILAHDPDGKTVPYMLSGGTDAKAFAKLGIRCFGFAPLQLPPELDFAALFHGVDERVPVDALLFGTNVFEHFLHNS